MSDDTQNSQGENGASDNGDAAVNQEAEKWKNEFLYLRAEFENYKRNAIKERSELAKYGSERVIRDLLPIIDNFERALSMNVNPQNLSDYVRGIEMTSQELKGLLQKSGVQEIPSEGHMFNPQVHEAISSEERDNVPDGQVLKVFQKGYRMHDKVIRPGQVLVSTKPSSN
ncbi:MAG: nucleotide exchange factor GrpE [Bdellovibrionota bacterium]